MTDDGAARRGRSFLQALIALLIATIVVAIAIPVYGAQARTTALNENACSVRITAMSFCIDAASPTSAPAAQPAASAPGTSPSGTTFAGELEASLANGLPGTPTSHYVNPFTGRRSIISSADPPTTTRTTAPAVWITDNAEFRFRAIPARGNAATRSRLRGAVIVNFDRGTQSVEIFFIDGDGARSATCDAVSLA